MSLFDNRRKKYCFDGWEHYNPFLGKWTCGKKIVRSRSVFRGAKSITGKELNRLKKHGG